MRIRRPFIVCMAAIVMAAAATLPAQSPQPTPSVSPAPGTRARATGDQRRHYLFAPTGQQLPFRLFVPPAWDGKAALPVILMLHGGGADENTYMDMSNGLLMKLAAQHGYIVVSPLGFTPLGAYGNPLRLPAVYGLDAAAAGVIISTGYLAAIVVNLLVGLLADRYNKLFVLACLFVLLAAASASMTVNDLLTFRMATAAVIGIGFTAANQLYGLAGGLMPREQAANAMGVVSLGAGLFGFFGPQMLGILRDWTGSFAAGFYMVAIADVITLGLIAVLYRMTRGRAAAQ